jgi:hypothetical protein
MSERCVIHSTFSIERVYDTSADRVFASNSPQTAIAPG